MVGSSERGFPALPLSPVYAVDIYTKARELGSTGDDRDSLEGEILWSLLKVGLEANKNPAGLKPKEGTEFNKLQKAGKRSTNTQGSTVVDAIPIHQKRIDEEKQRYSFYSFGLGESMLTVSKCSSHRQGTCSSSVFAHASPLCSRELLPLTFSWVSLVLSERGDHTVHPMLLPAWLRKSTILLRKKKKQTSY